MALKNLMGCYTLLRQNQMQFGFVNETDLKKNANLNLGQPTSKATRILTQALDAKHAGYVFNFKSNFFISDKINIDICEDFIFKSPYENILGEGKFSEVRKLTHKKNKREYAVKTFRLQQLRIHKVKTGKDLLQDCVWR